MSESPLTPFGKGEFYYQRRSFLQFPSLEGLGVGQRARRVWDAHTQLETRRSRPGKRERNGHDTPNDNASDYRSKNRRVLPYFENHYHSKDFHQSALVDN
jgi:hypothetical protein